MYGVYVRSPELLDRRTGGLEKECPDCRDGGRLDRRTGGLEIALPCAQCNL